MTCARRFALAGALFALTLPGVAMAMTAPIYTGLFDKVAVSGYDPVAYFRTNMPVKGSSEFKAEHQGAEFHFADAADLAAFKADPARYAPQYGGYCAWAVSQGGTASADPKVWRIVDGKLYLNYSKSVGQKWS